MRFLSRTPLVLAGLLVLVLASIAGAQPRQLQPGSVLVFPLIDNRPGHGTMVSVTNLLDDDRACPAGERRGDVVACFRYVDGDTMHTEVMMEWLVPGDTLSVLTDRVTGIGAGYLVVVAYDPVNLEPMDFDFLMGSAVIAQAGPNFIFSYTPYAFEALPRRDGADPCSRRSTDVDGDGAIDFDGTEYSSFPKALVIESFIEERGIFGNSLTLLTTAEPGHTAELEFVLRNNGGASRHEGFFEFDRWWTGTVSDISFVAQDLGGDRGELGFREVETGWMRLRGSRILDGSGNPVRTRRDRIAIPPVLGVFSQYANETAFAGGHALQYVGSLDGMELLGGDRDRQRR